METDENNALYNLPRLTKAGLGCQSITHVSCTPCQLPDSGTPRRPSTKESKWDVNKRYVQFSKTRQGGFAMTKPMTNAPASVARRDFL